MVQDLEHIKTIDERLQLLQEKFVLVNGQETIQSKHEQGLEERRVHQRQAQQQRQMLLLKLDELQKAEKELQQPLLDLVKTWRSVHAQQLQVPAFSDLEHKRKQVAEHLQSHQQGMHASLMYKEQYLQQKELVHKFEIGHAQIIATRIQEHIVKLERIKLESEHYKTMIAACDKRAGELLQEKSATATTLNSLRARQKLITVDSKVYEAILKQFEKRKAHYQNWITLGNFMTIELQNLDRKKQLSQDENNPCCPLCEQNLSSSRRRFLKDRFMREEQFLKHRIARITRTLQKLKVLLFEQHEQLTQFNNQKELASKISTQIDDAQAKVLSIAQEIDANEQQKRICDQQVALFARSIIDQEKEVKEAEMLTRESLSNDPLFRQALDRLQVLEKAAADNVYDASKHDQLRSEFDQIDRCIKSHQDLTQQIAMQESRVSQIHALVVRLKKIKQELSVLHEEQNKYQSVAEQEKELLAAEQELLKSKTDLQQN